ncbi:MAG: tape measure protein [Qipengyuania sp.]|uniref:tape measure protein n=1 Tax=Qipengyuania sp. TaxID=2004515 RepID=UPI0030017D71
MAEVSPVVFEFHARTTKFRSDVRGTTNVVGSDLDRMEARFRANADRISSTMRGLGATLATALGAREIGSLVDDFTRLQNALKVAGLEGEQLAEVQERLYELGSRYGVSVNALADLYGNVSQAGRELGASQTEILTLTEAVSQSLLITGKSSSEAAGATLGLVQALAAGKVQAQEYQQINEGGLRPLLEAAAASEKYGGSINKLRTAIYNGEVASDEFYRAILDNSELLENKAANATITLSGAFQSLNDQLGKYLGEAGQASGATGAMAEAIKALADNLDVIIPALAVIATSMGVRLVASAIAGSNAVFALTAVMGGAATATEGLALALNGLAKSLPFLAITAVVAALGYLALKSSEATEATGEYKRVLEQSEGASDKAREAAERLANAHGQTRKEALQAAEAEREHTKQKLSSARASLILAQAELKRARAFQAAQNQASFGSTGLPGTATFIQGKGDTKVAQARANVAAQEVAIRNFEDAIRDLDAAIRGSTPPSVSTGGGSASTSKKTSGRARSGPDAAELAARQEAEIARLRAEEIQARLNLTEDIDERANLQAELDSIEFAQRRADIEGNADLSRAQKDAQLEILNGLFGVSAEIDEQGRIIVRGNEGLYAQIREREAQLEEIRREGQLDADTARAKEEVLRSQLSITSDREERARLEKQILDIQIQAAKDHLREQIATAELARGQEKRVALLKQQLANLDGIAANEAEGIARDYESPLQRYARGLNESDLGDEAEQLIVDEIETVRGGIRDAIADAIGTDDPLITGLLDLLLQDLIFKPLANSLANAGGGSGGGLLQGIGSVIGSIFGGARASGGYVSPGTMYRVNEGASPGRVEGFSPAGSGEIIPLGQMNALANGGMRSAGGGVAVVRLELSGDIDARIDQRSTNVAVEVTRATAPRIIDAAANETARRFSRPKL